MRRMKSFKSGELRGDLHSVANSSYLCKWFSLRLIEYAPTLRIRPTLCQKIPIITRYEVHDLKDTERVQLGEQKVNT